MTNNPITITPTGSRTALYCRYQGQTAPQGCYLELDPASREVQASYDGEIGDAVPMSVWHGRIRRYTIPCLTAEAADRLMADLTPHLARVCDGYSEHWDGSNTVGRLTADAEDAEGEIESITHDTDFGEAEMVCVWDASDWLSGIGTLEAQAQELGITAETTDAQLAEIEARCNAEAAYNGIDILERCDVHLERLREAMQDK